MVLIPFFFRDVRGVRGKNTFFFVYLPQNYFDMPKYIHQYEEFCFGIYEYIVPLPQNLKS